MEELIGKLLEYPLQRSNLARLVVFAYNVGDLIKAVYYSIHYGSGINDPAYRGEIKCALADTYVQLLVLIKILGFEEEEIRRLGEMRLKEFIERRLRK